MNSEILDRLPPQDVTAEKRVLYAMLVRPAMIDELAEIVREENFYADVNQRVFKALLAMHMAGQRIDPDTLVQRLRRDRDIEAIGGPAYVLADILTDSRFGRLDAASQHARAVLDCSHRRMAINAALEMLRDAYEPSMPIADILETAEASLGAIRTEAVAEHLIDAPAAAIKFMDHVDAMMARSDEFGVATGIEKFDTTFGGLFPGEYCILAGDSSSGKTSLGAQIADHNAAKGRLVYVASLEMEDVELTQRIVCAIASINSRLIRTRRLSGDDRAALAEGVRRFSERKIRIDDRTDLKVSDIRRAARRLLKDGLSLVMVDYIGLVEPDDYKSSREQQVARISRGLKNLAKELRVPVLALCQLNRAHETSERPVLKNLRESGAIGNDAHMVLFLHRPPDGIVDVEWRTETGADGRERNVKQTLSRAWPAELILAKNRNSETGTVKLDWKPHETRFADWDRSENNAADKMDNYDHGFDQCK